MKKREKEKKEKKRNLNKNFHHNFFQKCSWVHFRWSLTVISLKLYSFVTPHSRRPILRKFFPSQFFPKMFLSSLPVLPNGYFLKWYSFVTPHSRRPILRKFFQHIFFQKCSWVHFRCSHVVIFHFITLCHPLKANFLKNW